MRVLAVDTATFTGGVAVLEDGRLLAESAASVRAAHGETLLPHVRRTLEMAGLGLADLDLLAVGLGPGSFTGVRIGVATIKGLCLAEDKPVVGVCSLQVIAAGMLGAGALRIPALDAYKGEVYTAAYQVGVDGAVRPLVAPLHALPAEAGQQLRQGLPDFVPDGALVAGDGLTRYPGQLEEALGFPCVRAPGLCDVPRAAVLAELALRQHAEHGPDDLIALEPHYVRASDARLPSRPLKMDV